MWESVRGGGGNVRKCRGRCGKVYWGVCGEVWGSAGEMWGSVLGVSER